jgi:capsular polysaccharide biosynthesis protein
MHTVATLTTPWQSNYFHWLFGLLPRIHLIERAGLTVDKFYVECKTKFQKETLRILGYLDEQLINADQVDFVSAARLIIPSLPGVPGIMPAWACNYLRQKFIKNCSWIPPSLLGGGKEQARGAG